MELFEALNTTYTYQTVGEDNGVDTSWVFDNGTQKLGVKMAAIKPGALKKYKPSERVAQFFLFRVTDTGKTGGAPKQIFKPFQSISTLSRIIAAQCDEHKLNAFVVRFPKDMKGDDLINLMQRVANKVSKIKYEQKGFYSFDGLQFSYGLFVRQGRDIDSYFGKEWSKYLVHQDVLEYAASFAMTSVQPPIKKMQAAGEAISGLVRNLDKQNIRMGIPHKIIITDIAGGDDIPANVEDLTDKSPNVYQKEPSAKLKSVDTSGFKLTTQAGLKDMFSNRIAGMKLDYDEETFEQTEAQASWERRFRDQQINPAHIASGEALDFLEEWLSEGLVHGWINKDVYRNANGTVDLTSLISDAARGYIDEMSSIAYDNYSKLNGYVKESDSEAVDLYTSNFYRAINSSLLSGEMSDAVSSAIKNLDNAFRNSGVRLPTDMLLYRGMNLDKNLTTKILKGKAFYFRPYVSTSLRPNIGLFSFNADFHSYLRQSRNVGVMNIDQTIDKLDIANTEKIDPTIPSTLIIQGAYKVPVIVPGDASNFPQECEVILSRGTTMRVNNAKFTEDKTGNYSQLFGVLDMEVMGADEVQMNEQYDGDHFVETGKLKKMDFASFMEAKRKPKKSASDNRIDFMTAAIQSPKSRARILTKKEKEAAQRIKDKFCGDLM